MSTAMTARVWALTDPELKDARLLTLLSLADHANGDDDSWPSIPTIAKKTRVSERQVQRCIQWLDEQGYIEITTKGNGRGKKTAYKLLSKGDTMTPFVEEKGDTTSPIPANLLPVDSIKGDIGNVKGDIGDVDYSHAQNEPIQQPTTEGEKEIAADAAHLAPATVAKPKPKRSRKSQTPPNTSGAPPPREPTEWQLFLEAMCWVCHGHKKINELTEVQKGALTAEAKRIRANQRTIDDLRKWFATVWQPGWQWQKNRSRPKPSEVRSSLPALDSETPEGFEDVVVLNGNHVNGTSKVAGSLAALDDYEVIKLRHGVNT